MNAPHEREIAARWKALYEGQFIYVPERKDWYQFDDRSRCWRPGARAAVVESIMRVCDDANKEHLVKALGSAAFFNGVEAILKIMTVLHVGADKLDTHSEIIGTPDGPYWLAGRGDAFDEDERRLFITMRTAVAPKGGEPVLWMSFIRKVTGGDEWYAVFLMQMAGLCLSGVTKEQICFYIYGPGGSGKSTFMDTLAAIYGNYAKAADPSLFLETHATKHPTGLAKLRGVRLVLCSELDGKPLNEPLFKSWTGGDSITARQMYCDEIEFKPVGKLVFTSNSQPVLKRVHKAVRRRIILVPFNADFDGEGRDKDFGQKLKNEYPQILNWAIQGYRDYLKRGLVIPEGVREATSLMFDIQDMPKAFLEYLHESGQCRKDGSGTVFTRELLAAYQQFSEAEGEPCPHLTPRGLRELLSGHFAEFQLTPFHGRTANGYYGIHAPITLPTTGGQNTDTWVP